MIKNNTSVDGSTYVGPDGDEMTVSPQRRHGGQSAQGNPRANSISSHENVASSQTGAASGGAPTDGSRDATQSEAPNTPKKPTPAEIEAAIDERLCASDDQFKSDKEKLELLEKVNKGFSLIDSSQGWTNDGIVEGWDLQAVIDNPSAPAAAKEAAQILLSHPDLWKELAHKVVGDDKATFDDLKTVLEELRTKQKGKKDAIRTEVKNELNEAAGIKSDGSAATGGSSTASGGNSVAGSHTEKYVEPPNSNKPGMEGAAENISNALLSIADETKALSERMKKPDLSAQERQDIQTRQNELQLNQQMLTAMYTQLQQVISNLMKMYSDAAANAVRNMR